MTGADVFFTPVDPNEPDPDPEGPDDSLCSCQTVDGMWKLLIEEGGISLKHSVCDKYFPQDDLMETVYMEPTDVLLSLEKETCHCLYSCDCDFSIVLTLPR